MTAYGIPSLIALVFKGVLLAYGFKSPRRDSLTKTYLALLVLLSVYNVIETFGFIHYRDHGLTPLIQQLGFAYIALLIPSIAIILHLSLRLSFDFSADKQRWLFLLYVPVVILEYLLLFTDKLVLGFEPFLYSILRVPGPYYSLFETFAVGYTLASVANLIVGARGSRSSFQRTRNRLWLFAISPMALLLAYLITANHFGWTKLTSTVYVPLAMTFFLVVTSYATHQYRLFDIEFFVPWSRIRKRKTAFYGRIQSMIAEIANLGAVDKAVEKLSEALRCSVALIGTDRPVLALANGPTFMTEIPADVLRRFDRIVVANEIAETLPDVHAVMKNHGVAAIVPFHPHSKHAQGWLLLGESFSEQVYTARDFRVVEQLFDKMADLFLDQVLTMRAQLNDASRQIRVLERRQHQLYADIDALQDKNQVLERQVAQMLREQRVDAVAPRVSVGVMPQVGAATITLIGRDKSLLKRLRALYPQAEQFAGVTSSALARQAPPELVLAQLTGNSAQDEAVLRWLRGHPTTAALVYGPAVSAALTQHKENVRGLLLEALPAEFTDEALARQTQALIELRRHLFDAQDIEQPLLGQNTAFAEAMAEARRVAPMTETLVIQADDPQQGLAFAAHVHHLSGSQDAFTAVKAADLATADESVWPRGTLVVHEVGNLDDAIAARLVALRNAKMWRLVVVSAPAVAQALTNVLFPLTLTLPALTARRDDLPLLVHYFTVQFNLQAGGGCVFLRQTDVDAMMQEGCPATVAELRHRVFELLKSRSPAPLDAAASLKQGLSDKTLDEHIAEYEAHIIAQTIKRCDGNKSKAARLLGLRPNTLHYKLRRYGVVGEQES